MDRIAAPDPFATAFVRAPARLALEGARHAAVALVTGPGDSGGPEVLLIRRADKDGDPWSGHVGLPGGHLESGESFEQAAVRETLEEVGLDLRDALLLGVLDDCGTPALIPSRVVRPFVFRLDVWPALTLEDREIAGAFRVPLAVLQSGEGRASFPYDFGGRTWTLPCVDLPVGRLWGMTLRIVDDLLDRLDGRGHGMARLSQPTLGR